MFKGIILMGACMLQLGLTAQELQFATHKTHFSEDEAVKVADKEIHLANIRQLTFGGSNVNGKISLDGKKVSFESNNPVFGLTCYQVFWLDINEASDNRIYQPMIVSNNQGRATDGCYLPDVKKLLFNSTHLGGAKCPIDQGKITPVLRTLNPDCDLFIGDEKGKSFKAFLPHEGYDGEPVISATLEKVLFTSMRSGNPELFLADLNGKNLKQLTYNLGFDGNASVSTDGKSAVFVSTTVNPADSVLFMKELALEMVQTNQAFLNMMQLETGVVTKLGLPVGAYFNPVFVPGKKQILFSAMVNQKANLYLYHLETNATEQVTFEDNFNGYASFTPDGKQLVFSSSRGAQNEINLFVVDWVE